ncbi:hypothetical protein [Glaciimonas sp. PAMC28666]|uniref:hypothetical protein n=1 Tax=Glaciimonas sp. PAMC28666 TaxID=2807626 RepID=UPI001962EF05|nr:hypothetical protein [Glaciimonas sp. PAMC28666]QRX81668.1 hypothetical protein JQN73_16135 [Glaciimonas sp. PAMC28666]
MIKPKMTTPSPSSAPITEALHQPFSWLPAAHQNDRHAQFYAMTVDICQGVKTCIDLAHLSNSDRNTDTMPTLAINATERLMRLAYMSSQLLAGVAEGHIDALTD